MALGLNTLSDGSLPSIDVNKNISLSSTNSNLNKNDITGKDLIKMEEKMKNNLNKAENGQKKNGKESLNYKIKKILKSPEIKKKIDNVVAKYASKATNEVNGYETCLKQELNTIKGQLKKTDDVFKDNVEDFKNYIPSPNKFLSKITDKIIKYSPLDSKHHVKNFIKRLDNCNSVNTKPSSALDNTILSAVASQMIENADCSDGKGIEAMACTTNGLFSDVGIKSSMVSKIIRQSSDKINITSKTLDKISQNDKLKEIAKIGFKHKKTIMKAFKYKDKFTSYIDTGKQSINIFGHESIKDIADLTRKNKTNSNVKSNDFFLAGAIKQVINTVTA